MSRGQVHVFFYRHSTRIHSGAVSIEKDKFTIDFLRNTGTDTPREAIGASRRMSM